MSIDDTGNYTVAWLNRLAPGGPAVEIKQVDLLGTITAITTFASDVAGYNIEDFEAQSAGGLYYLVWQGFAAAGPQLFLTVIDPNGTDGLASLVVTDDEMARPVEPDMFVDAEGYILTTWLDSRTGSKSPYRQIFDPAYAPVESNIPVYTTTGPYMQAPAVAAYRGKGVFIWADGRNNGLNVYASQVIHSPTDIEDDGGILPSKYSLEQNYPNPFNPTTAIEFSLVRSGRVKLEVFNLLGQTVRTILDENYPAGRHTVTWDGTTDDGRRVASGVFFYRLSSNEQSLTRKMILMK